MTSRRIRGTAESKLSNMVSDWPLANFTSVAVCDGTVTANSSPAFGPSTITRVSRDLESTAATVATGPNICTSAVR